MKANILQQISEHHRVVESLKNSVPVLEQIAQLLVDAIRAGRRIYLFGNGGSAADAQHIAAELVGRFKNSNRPAIPAVALTTNTSNLTAIGNDFGFDDVFKRQVEALVERGDVVWALSVSGTSPNILRAVEAARAKGAKIISFTGQEGTDLKRRSDLCLTADHSDSDRVQEVHQLAYHIICGLVEEHFVQKK